VDLLVHRVPPGVDEAAKIKAEFLSNIAKGKESSSFFSEAGYAAVIDINLNDITEPILAVPNDPITRLSFLISLVSTLMRCILGAA